MVSMAETIGAHYPDIKTYYVHGALNSKTHATDKHVRQIAKQHGKMSVMTFYSNPTTQDVCGQPHDQDGFIAADWLSANTPFHNAGFFLCGPKPFLRTMSQNWRHAGLRTTEFTMSSLA